MTRYAEILLGCYRKDELPDADVFSAAVVGIFAKFPDDVVRAVVDPVSGLPSKSKWPPTLSEIVTACNDEVRHRETVARYNAMGERTLRPGRKFPPIPEGQDFDSMTAKYGRPYGPFEEGREHTYGATPAAPQTDPNAGTTTEKDHADQDRPCGEHDAGGRPHSARG